MNIRKLLIFAAGIANSARILQETPSAAHTVLEQAIIEKPSVTTIENSEANSRCHESKNAPVLLSLEEKLQLLPIKIDNLIVASDAFKKSKNAKFKIKMMKQLLNETLAADIVFCKLQTITELSKLKSKFWVQFKIKLLTPQEFQDLGYPNWEGMADVAPDSRAATTYIVKKNAILINMFNWNNYGKANAEEKEKIFASMRDTLIHEMHHAFIKVQNLQRIFNFETQSSDQQKMFLAKHKIHGVELTSAPYQTAKERDELLAAIKAGEKKIKDLQDIIKKCAIGKCTPDKERTIRLFKDETQHYKGYLRYLTEGELTESSLTNLLLQLQKVKKDVYKYPSHEQTLEFDAYYHGILSIFLKSANENQDLFHYLFSELLDWHDKHAPEEYKKCLQTLKKT